MQKTAQKRSLLNKLREMTDVGGIATEKLFSPEFKELMDKLRSETDDPIRAIVTGEQIGDASPPADGISLKDLLKSAHSNLNRREYMKAVAELGRFHKKMNDVVNILNSFNSNIDKVHEKFLFDGLDDESKTHLQDLKSRIAYRKNKEIVKEANILDFFTNLVTERGRALAGWEKRYPKQIGKLKKDTATLLSSSERLLSITLSVLKELASARAVRNPDKYIETSKKIIKSYEAYNAGFKSYYADNIKGFLEKQEFMAPTKDVGSETAKELGNQEITAPNVQPPPAQEPEQGGNEPFALIPKPQVAPPTPAVPAVDPVSKTIPVPPPDMPQSVEPPSAKMSPEEMKQFESQHGVVEAHKTFYTSLQKMSGEAPAILTLYINKYAKSIQSTDPRTAIQLFKIAKSIEL